MLFKELPIEEQTKLNEQRKNVCNEWKKNTPYEVVFTNASGTRYFRAHRECIEWHDDKGHYMPFGGGTRWRIKYGEIGWGFRRDALGFPVYELVKSQKRCFGKTVNGTAVPKVLATKKEVIELAKSIGTLVM